MTLIIMHELRSCDMGHKRQMISASAPSGISLPYQVSK